MSGELTLTAKLHRKAYQTMPSPQQAYILLDAIPTAAAPSAGGGPALNFSLVLDRSGSMAGEKLRQLKAAAKLVVDRLTPSDFLSIVIFDETADVIIPAGTVQDKNALKQKIDSIHERGGTKMSTGMQAALQE
jgi:Ca-activated chloride channel family protein